MWGKQHLHFKQSRQAEFSILHLSSSKSVAQLQELLILVSAANHTIQHITSHFPQSFMMFPVFLHINEWRTVCTVQHSKSFLVFVWRFFFAIAQPVTWLSQNYPWLKANLIIRHWKWKEKCLKTALTAQSIYHRQHHGLTKNNSEWHWAELLVSKTHHLACGCVQFTLM